MLPDIKKILNNLINCGVTQQLRIEEAQIIRLTNLFGIFPMLFFLVYIANGIVYDIPFFWKIGVINALLNILAIWCNYKAAYNAAKTILLASNSFILLLFTNVVVGNASAVAFFFPVLTCYVVFYDIIREWKIVVANLAVTAACILCCLMLPAQYLGKVPLPSYMSGNITRLNFMLAFCAFGFYVYLIIKVKLQTETLLIQSRETAEIMADKTEQMAEQLTIQKEKSEHSSRVKSLFLSDISDELIIPVNALLEKTNQLLELNKNTGISAHLTILKRSNEKILSIAKDIADFNKIESGKIKLDKNTFNLKLLIENHFSLPTLEYNDKVFSLNIKLDPALNKEVITDGSRLQQILDNITRYFFKYTNCNTVSLSAKLESSTSEAMKVKFFVSGTEDADDGNHPSTDYQHPGGTAGRSHYLPAAIPGLTMSNKLVQLFGGKLHGDREEGKTTAIYFTIPLAIDQNKKSTASEENINATNPLNGINVLLVEDNKINMLVARRFLSNWQVNITEAINGLEAVECFKVFSFDLVILDLEMPVMDGYDAIREIRKLNPAIPVIAFTASVFDDMKNKLLTAGFNDFISKPFIPEELYNKIARYAVRA